jgi:predicted PurR-regulated permease PerM
MTLNTSSTVAFCLKVAMLLVGLVAFFFILYIGKPILAPLIFAAILAIVLNPLVGYLTRKGVNRVVAIALALLLAIAVIAGVVYFLSSQVAHFSESFPMVKEKFKSLIDESVRWTSQYFNVRESVIRTWLTNAKAKGLEGAGQLLGSTLSTLGDVFAVVFLMPVYIFMILFYKPLLLEFIAQLFPRERHAAVGEVLVQTRTMIQHYLVGLLFEALIVAVLDSVGLLIIGIDYAILLGVIAALLNMIPYIGGLVAISLPLLMAFATRTPMTALLVLVVYLLVQFIDNNYIVPKVVASRVKLNALVSVVMVLFGGALWGVAGMFLAIPMTAIVKVVCDRLEPLRPLGYLLGDDQPHIGSTLLSFHLPGRRPRK